LTVVVFEDEHWNWFTPLTLLRHVAQLDWGIRTLLESWQELLPGERFVLWGRDELRPAAEARSRKDYNSPADEEVLLVNARVRPKKELLPFLTKKGHFAVMTGKELIAARTKNARSIAPGALSARTQLKASKGEDKLGIDEENLLFEGPWDLVESNGMAIAAQASTQSAMSGSHSSGTTLKGPPSNLRIHDSAEIDPMVSFDTRAGPVVVDEDAAVDSYSMLSGPCYVGRKTRLHSALVRGGTSMFENCRVGGEVENSIIMSFTNKAHHGFVGDTIIGEWANLGAGSTFSNLKNTYGTVKVDRSGSKVDTGLIKLGPVIGDMAKISIGTLIFAGKSVGVGSQVTGLIDQDVPSFTFLWNGTSKMVELRLESVIETQRRMMERRGIALSKDSEALIRLVFNGTRPDRRRVGVRKGKI
jgi:UDP-N-acetylglucosamine diphosphorylase/glucosamine-1-phosphate N-acetyltransferase